MLRELHISNYILIDDLDLDFTKGLTVITGESGAGKSIIINAIRFCLGAKASKDVIRDKEKKAKFEIVFETDDIFVITREIFPTSRSIYRLNGDIINSNKIQEITENLIDLYSQRDHNDLLNPKKQVEYIDNYLGNEIIEVLSKIKEISDKRKKIIEELYELKNEELDIEKIKNSYEEISKLNINVVNDQNLDAEYNKLININEIEMQINSTKDMLVNSSDLLNKCSLNIENIKEYDDYFIDINNRIESLYYEVKDVYEELSYYDIEETDSIYLAEIEQRTSELDYLKKKYQKNIKELYNYNLELEEKIEKHFNKGENIKKLEKEIKDIESIYDGYSKKLAELRLKSFNSFKKDLISILNDISIKNAKFKLNINFDDNHNYRYSGAYNLEILISINNMDYKPLKDTASGGELSRIMLALKTIFSKNNKNSTIIFDEIDVGISGKSAFEVGKKIKNISREHQVIAITHLPQLVCFADSHLLVDKESTTVSVTYLKEDKHINRLAFMMSSNISKKSIETAKELILKANKE